METKLGQEPAFPIENKHVFNPQYNGMSKRFYAACAAMQGILSAWVNDMSFPDMAKPQPSQQLIATAYVFADELLKQESE